ncbi:MAG: cyclase family protein [Acidimicrobiales bacterium]|nr:cyclase family protein [Acidimicrobiales bacterium]
MALPQEFLDIQAQVRNWGRWGDDDRLGTLNFLTDEVVRAAATEVQTGRRISLATPLESNGMQLGAIPGRVNAELTTFAVNMSLEDRPEAFHTSDDAVTMGLQAGTHWDGLAHVSYDGQVYGGRPASIITEEAGAGEIGIENVRSICGRGVLLDVARAKGVDELDFGYAITADDLDTAVAAQGTEIRSGDIALIRTGLMRRYHAGEKENYNGWSGSPGPGLSCVPWFHRHELAAVATDTFIFEVYPSELETAALGVHMLDVVDMGLTQGQNWDLEALAADCAADGRYSFFLEASPQPFVGACGSPVNPVAIK